MMKTKTLLITLVGCAFLLAGARAEDLRLEDCPAAVQQTILANARDGRVDEIELSADGRSYEVEINLPRLRERHLLVAASGEIQQMTEDIDPAEAPEAVRRTIETETPSGGRLEDLEKKTSGTTTTFQAEIDLPDDRDLSLELSDNGSILSRNVRD